MNAVKSIRLQMECYSLNNPRGTDVKGGLADGLLGMLDRHDPMHMVELLVQSGFPSLRGLGKRSTLDLGEKRPQGEWRMDRDIPMHHR